MSGPTDKVKPFEPRPRPDAGRVREFAETARRLQRERIGTADVVARILDTTPRAEWPSLASRGELRTSGGLEHLAARLRARCEKDPQEALALSSLATAIAETLPPDAYPGVTLAQLRAQAWKDRAHTLRFLGRYDEALDAVAMAERALAPFPTTAYDRAVVALVKASIFQQVERFDESRILLAECARVFRDHGDAKQYLYCSMINGTLLYRLADYPAAKSEFTKLLEMALDAGDIESTARLHNNLAYCAVQLGHIEEGKAHVGQAKEIFYDLGREIEAIRSDRAFARLLLKNGDTTHGIILLRNARQSFLRHELVEEGGLCGLLIAEAFVGRGDFALAADLVREVITEFAEAGLNARAIRAMELLEDGLDSRHASAATVEQVAQYIESLRLNPDRELIQLIA